MQVFGKMGGDEENFEMGLDLTGATVRLDGQQLQYDKKEP
jgi:hypothetical protein